MDATTVHPREVFQEAIRWGAYAIMVAHNHPSGDPTPSSQDAELTRKLVEVSRIMAIFFYLGKQALRDRAILSTKGAG